MSRKKILTIFMIGCLIAFSIHISSLCYKYYSYAKDNTFIFVRENTMGLLNSYGKEI